MSINVTMIRESFATAKPIIDQVVARFYENLASDFPESTPLFAKVDMVKQKAALRQSLIAAVENLDKPEILSKFLLGLGERHVAYGAVDLHYSWVGQTLLKTFAQFFGAAWTPELSSQWTEVYGVIADVMKKGALAASTAQVRSISGRERLTSNDTPALITAIEAEVPALSIAIREEIRLVVRATVLKQIKAEVKKWFDEEMRDIARTAAEESTRKAG